MERKCAKLRLKRNLLNTLGALALGIFLSPVAFSATNPCIPIFEDLENPYSQKVQEFFAQMPPSWMEQISATYNRTIEADKENMAIGSRFVLIRGTEERPIGSRQLAKRLAAGDDHAMLLPKLGWELTTTRDGHSELSVPQSLEIYFSRFVHLAIHNGLVPGRDIFPAISFIRKGKKNVFLEDCLYVTPGLDPLPDPQEYDLAIDRQQLSHLFWEDPVAKGKMPFFFNQGIFHHDSSHSTELLDLSFNRSLSSYYRKAALRDMEWRLGISHAVEKRMEVSPQQRTHMERVYVFGENLILPNLKEKASIKKLMPWMFDSAKLQTFDEMHTIFSAPNFNLENHVKELLANRYKVFTRHGGGARDADARERFLSNEILVEHILKLMTDGLTVAIRGKSIPQDAISETLEGMILQSWMASQLLYHWDERPFEERASFTNFTLEARTTQLRNILIDRLARVDMAMSKGLKLGLTPEQFIVDSGEKTISKKSKTYRYIKSFAIPGGYNEDAFLSNDATGNGLDP